MITLPHGLTPLKYVRSKKLIAVHSKFITLVTICFFTKSDSLLIVWTCDTLRIFFFGYIENVLFVIVDNITRKYIYKNLIMKLLEVLHSGYNNRFEPHCRFPVMFGY